MAINLKKAKPVRPASGPGAAAARIEWLEIRGLRAFDWLHLDIPHGRDEVGQWIVLLGDNGTGKTTLLRAIALALIDPSDAYLVAADIDAGETFFRQTDAAPFENWGRDYFGSYVQIAGERCPRGYVRKASPTPDDGAVGPSLRPIDTLAYGSRRADALGSADRDVPLQHHRDVLTLFNKDARLVHAETWLRREKLKASNGGRFFDALLDTLSSLLPGGERLTLEADEVLVVGRSGERIPLSALSDGYLTTLGWTIDLIARWANRYRDTGKLDENFAKDMPCVVLVDELDLHLHPRWQLDIIPRLRAAFPKTTFVVTTHNPLTLQGTRPGEVFVLQKDDATGQISITQRDVPPGTDANRLLTGDWFGLGSTLDESTLRKLDRHRELLRTRRPESAPERRALEQELRVRLNGFADTSYERMALDVIAELHDEKMRQRKDITAEDRERVVREVRARLAALDGPKGSREPATGAREPAPTYRPAKPPGKTPPRSTSTSSRKPSPRTPTAKPKLAARTKPR